MRYEIKVKGERLKVKGILILFFFLSIFNFHFSTCWAFSYQPVTYSAPATGFRSTSAYNGSMQPAGSLSAISAANYEALNSEGGACYHPSAVGPRKGRPQENDYGGTGAIGNLDYHSPVGDVPWALLLILAAVWGVRKRMKIQKMHKNR